MPIAAVVFDAYGTLFDVHSVARRADELFPGHGASISSLWRQRQIDYTRIRTLSGRYAPFSEVTASALHYTLERLGLVDEPGERQLLASYEHLEVFPENRAVLLSLGTRAIPLAVLSNGDSTMLATALSNADLARHFAHVLSADEVRRYKTAPEVYALAEDAFRARARDMVFVSSNCWDACGAAWYGFRSFWVNRAHEPLEALGVKPDATADTMTPLVDYVDRLATV